MQACVKLSKLGVPSSGSRQSLFTCIHLWKQCVLKKEREKKVGVFVLLVTVQIRTNDNWQPFLFESA